MNIDYIELTDMTLVTDEKGNIKRIENTDNTKDILIAENKVESLEDTISELETKLDKSKFGFYLIMLIVSLLLGGLSLSISFWGISASLLPNCLVISELGLTCLVGSIAFFTMGFEQILELKKIYSEKKGLKKTIAVLKAHLDGKRKELERIKNAKLTPIETKTSQITHIEETIELLKFKKYLVAMKYYSTKLAKLKRMNKQELEEYLSVLDNPEIETDINMILSRTPNPNKNS
ncbi:unknown [Mycoplasma sp. CAG:776]|nr:unknown [Mycoplasma sp. CAG:776]